VQSCRNHRTQPWRRSADDFVAALRNPSDPDHGLVARTYAPLFQRSLCHYYLRGLACATHRVHFLCTETMADDWSALVARSGLNDSDHPIEHVTHNCSRCRRPRHSARREALSDESSAYVREMYRADTMLWKRVCGGRHGAT